MEEKAKKQELTKRQQEVLNLLQKGLTNGEICRALDISENTVKIHLANIYKTLEVSNRTEAVAAAMEQSAPPQTQEIALAVVYGDSYKDNPLAHDLALSVVESMRSFGVFQIQFYTAENVPDNIFYQIGLTTPQEDEQGLFVSLHLGANTSLLWSTVQRIESRDQIELFADQIAIQLYRNIILSATETFETYPEANPKWWYASCYTIVKMENRNKELFEKCESIQQSLLNSPVHRDFVVTALSAVYYAALTEHRICADECAVKLGKIACETMRENPSSIYSQYSIALYNMFLGNCNEAITNFENLLQTRSPISIVCRRLLAQLYAIVGRTEEARIQLEEYDQRIPKNMHQPFQYVADAYIAFISRDYEKCAAVSEQLLMFHPEQIFGRLFMIACSNKQGNTEKHESHIKALFEHHPNFALKDMGPFLDVFPPSEKDHILDCLSSFLDIFRKN